MTEVSIRNPYILKQLDKLVEDFFSHKDILLERFWAHEGEKKVYNPILHAEIPDGLYYTNEENLKLQMEKGDAHSGFPEQHFSLPIANMADMDSRFETIANDMRESFRAEIAAASCALSNYYPPGGFVGWHTNWNATARQILFTWSKTGDGCFKYLDKTTNEIVTIQDEPGWKARYYYFGPQSHPDYHCWHAAYAGCDRITLAYKFLTKGPGTEHDEHVKGLLNMLIEELEDG